MGMLGWSVKRFGGSDGVSPSRPRMLDALSRMLDALSRMLDALPTAQRWSTGYFADGSIKRARFCPGKL